MEEERTTGIGWSLNLASIDAVGALQRLVYKAWFTYQMMSSGGTADAFPEEVVETLRGRVATFVRDELERETVALLEVEAEVAPRAGWRGMRIQILTTAHDYYGFVVDFSRPLTGCVRRGGLQSEQPWINVFQVLLEEAAP